MTKLKLVAISYAGRYNNVQYKNIAEQSFIDGAKFANCWVNEGLPELGEDDENLSEIVLAIDNYGDYVVAYFDYKFKQWHESFTGKEISIIKWREIE